ncbi:MAG TPA: glycosyltransferase family 87 protein [Chloroflexia bacterium]|nr:glycosyltransferase family 87 protein [Chloroflexia bacterium]
MKQYFKYGAYGLLALYCLFIISTVLTRQDYLWDFKCYYFAVKAYNEGLNPYDTQNLINHYGFYLYAFVYPPLTLLAFQPLSWLDYQVAAWIFVLVKLIMLGILLTLWQRFFLEKQGGLVFYLLCLLAFNGTLFIDFSAGNISIIEQFFLWWAFYFWLKGRLKLFCAAVLVAAFFKLVPLAFLGLLIFSRNPRRWYYLGSSSALGGLLIGASWLYDRALFGQFLKSMGQIDERGIYNPSLLSLLRDILKIPPMEKLSLLDGGLYLLIAVIITAVSWYYLRPVLKLKKSPDREKLILFLACLVYGLVAPRFKDYSYILLIPAVYFLWLKLNELGKLKPLIFLVVAVMLPSANRNMLGNATLPGFTLLTQILTQYHSLLLAALTWGFYLYYLRIAIPKRTWRKVTFQAAHNYFLPLFTNAAGRKRNADQTLSTEMRDTPS